MIARRRKKCRFILFQHAERMKTTKKRLMRHNPSIDFHSQITIRCNEFACSIHRISPNFTRRRTSVRKHETLSLLKYLMINCSSSSNVYLVDEGLPINIHTTVALFEVMPILWKFQVGDDENVQSCRGLSWNREW